MLKLPPLPWVPTINTYYAHSRNGGVRISDRGMAYRNEVIVLLMGVAPNPLAGFIKMTARFHRPDHKRRDLDNLLKPMLDALKHAGIYADDSQIEHIDAAFAPLPLTNRRGTVDVTIEALKPAKKSRKTQT